jgi:hypothetical protein
MSTPKPTFLTLPGEIRNHIYALLLVIPPPSTTTALGEKSPIYPHILRVNRQIHAEALPILYGENTFIAHPTLLCGLPQLRRWLDPVTAPALIARIRKYHIFVRLECDARFSKEAATEAFSGMEELTIEVFQSQFRGSGNEVLRLFEGVREVGRARVFGSIGEWPGYVEELTRRMMSKEGYELEEKREGMGGLEGISGSLEAREVLVQ